MAHLLSKKVITLLEVIHESAATKSHAAAVEGARMRLKSEAPENVCLTCEKAEWFAQWGAVPRTDEKEWLLVLSACGAGISLQPNDGLGLQASGVPFCTAQQDDSTSGGVSRLRPVRLPAKSGPVDSDVDVPRQRGASS